MPKPEFDFQDAEERLFDAVTLNGGGAPLYRCMPWAYTQLKNEGRSIDDVAAQFIAEGKVSVTPEQRITEALAIARGYGRDDGSHHKAFAIDQMCRVLAGENYRAFVREACDGEHGPNTYNWDTGVPG